VYIQLWRQQLNWGQIVLAHSGATVKSSVMAAAAGPESDIYKCLVVVF